MVSVRRGSIARGGLGWKLPVSRPDASLPRECPLPQGPDAYVEHGERPVTKLDRSLDQKIGNV